MLIIVKAISRIHLFVRALVSIDHLSILDNPNMNKSTTSVFKNKHCETFATLPLLCTTDLTAKPLACW